MACREGESFTTRLKPCPDTCIAGESFSEPDQNKSSYQLATGSSLLCLSFVHLI